ncbi:MAG TPA: CpaF family protein [Chloroflexi bacterium]|nr:MAG: type II secretion system protein E [Anaerolineaceae bacterium 4572_5.1]HEY85681.1 CpaF family protein [Chloroflexota bacterium]
MSLLKRIEKSHSAGNEPSRLEELRIKKAPATPRKQNAIANIKERIQDKLLAELDPQIDITQTDEIRRTMEDLFNHILSEEAIILSRSERQNLFEQIAAEILGFGPLEPLLADETVSEIMVNGPKHIYVEQSGRLTRASFSFESDDHVLRIIDRIVSPLGRRIDESSPLVDARLPDGSRVNAIIPPLALNGPTLTIRKFSKTPLTIDNLIQYGSITPEAAEFMKACVLARTNIVVSGGTGSGKTTLLNICSNFIPDDERIITVENAAELQLAKEHVVTLESRPPNIEGKGEVSIQDLVINTLRMRPDRIVVGECRGGEALDMLQAMNTGHDGSLTTAHANTPRDTISRLETMCLMAGMDLPVRAIREQIASAVDVIIQQQRMRDGSRKVINITEVQGMEGDVVVLSDIFAFEQQGFEGGKVIGRLKPTGMRPKFMDRIEDANIHLPPNIFGAGNRLY